MTSSMIEVLTPIWQRVLQRSQISSEDDFFDLGGTPAAAQLLFAEIAKICGRELSPATICYAPTIAKLAEALRQPPQALTPLVLLNQCSVGAPVFLAQGIGSTVADFVPLARSIAPQRPVYGMQTRGMDGMQEPFDRVEDMAQWFLQSLQEVQPHGPYFFAGYSFGGLIMLEIAQRLIARGERIAMLTMIDSYPNRRSLSIGQRVRLKLRQLRLRASGAFDRAKQRRASPGPESIAMPDGSRILRAAEGARKGFDLALRRYQPCFYDGRINFVRAETVTFFPDDPAAMWARHAREFQVETVPGNHVEMIAKHGDILAATLSRYLSEACSGLSRSE